MKSRIQRSLSFMMIGALILGTTIFAKDTQVQFEHFRKHSLIISKDGEKSCAINPATGLAYFFWFVNNTNTSPSADGTFENPFPTLADVQSVANPNDIIYVYQGNGTDAGMDTGFNLLAGQQFLGAGIKQRLNTTLGCVKIPAQSKCLPFVSDRAITTTPAAAITASAGNNVIAGCRFVDVIGGGSGANTACAVRITGGLNYLLKKNVIEGINGGNALDLYGGAIS